ncbi:HD domain-containing protein [Salipaludibacillus agaradhaerens]|jgi:(p)ppGpp synthase/HD superfamily hydrolase|uniref:HD domain-containing protein n=1 Tax=Salipaludibacillus agaradhaerens TaxID=76935 RepID=A0A9Q4FZJ8_SALAG|nr:HD domain-containing protein [Salipaludibacillus agaradhaerens]MCR6097187.1 HD domain-containing protein [Salipaludibacillus agaradhaerens]MCR6113328.1 HD domain-containing protein [Salipaludibacillus agaradhaerens]
MVVPKFNYGDIVQFHQNDNNYYGKVEIIDEYGTWGTSSNVPSYDVFSEKDNCLFKHFKEPNLRLIAKANTVTEKAFLLAEQAHAGQKDLAGVDYIFHLIGVSQNVRDIIIEEPIIATAFLHDILEDTNTREDALSVMFPKEIVDAVRTLTRETKEAYEDYLNRVKTNEVARIVKLADLQHNMDITRIKNPTKRDFERIEKYRKAMLFLQD